MSDNETITFQPLKLSIMFRALIPAQRTYPTIDHTMTLRPIPVKLAVLLQLSKHLQTQGAMMRSRRKRLNEEVPPRKDTGICENRPLLRFNRHDVRVAASYRLLAGFKSQSLNTVKFVQARSGFQVYLTLAHNLPRQLRLCSP